MQLSGSSRCFKICRSFSTRLCLRAPNHLPQPSRYSVVRHNKFTTVAMATPGETPKATKKPHTVLIGHVDGQNRGPNPMKPPRELHDDYFWLRDDNRKNEDVLAYLKEENEYAQAQTAHLQELRESLYLEMKGHLKETDTEVPYKHGPYLRYTRTEEGKSYKIHCRQPVGGGAEEIILDENKLAEGENYCDVGTVQPSPDHGTLGYTVDTAGYETYKCSFVSLSTGEPVINNAGAPEVIPEMDGALVWGSGTNEVYYLKQDEAHRPYQLWRHKMGEPVESDECLFTENDEKFWVSVHKTLSGRFIVLESESSETAEVHLIDLQDPELKLKCVQEREFGVLYNVDHHGEWLVITTNADGAKNFKLVVAPLATPGRAHWQPYPTAAGVEGFDYDPARMVRYTVCFESFIAVFGRQDGLTRLWLLQLADGALSSWRQVEFPEEAYTVGANINKDYTATSVRLSYSSLVTPSSTIECNAVDHSLTTLKETEVPNYDRTLYTSQRITGTASDGTEVPMSVVYRKDMKKDTPQPLFLYAYGSYGACMEPSFGANRLPLLDRGVVYVITHIRGGGEMGRHWYEDQGKYLTKRNTFTDFCDSAANLIEQGWTTADMLAIEGRSAGGLLMGAVLNMRPDLFKVALAGVPFVDIMTTMCDASIPLTVGEWEEWGNPNEEKFYEYMLSYSPVNNIAAQDYPSILITAGINDPRVAYWEPAKWCAKLRDYKTDSNPLLLKTDMGAGHFSASDRYKYLKERAFELAFVLDQLGLTGSTAGINSSL